MLKGFGYIVLHRNFRTRFSEIDIICEKDDSLYFVEVKTRTSSAFGEPEEAVTPHKFKKIQLGAQIYLSKFPTTKKLKFLVIALIVEGDHIIRFKLINV